MMSHGAIAATSVDVEQRATHASKSAEASFPRSTAEVSCFVIAADADEQASALRSTTTTAVSGHERCNCDAPTHRAGATDADDH
jgi:hypothetical protein